MRAPANRLYSPLILFLILLVTTSLCAQDSATKKLVTEATRLRENNNSPDSDLLKATKDAQDSALGFKDALRDWVESRLPKSKDALDSGYSKLQDRLNAELLKAGVRAPTGEVDEYGFVGRLELSRPSEFPGALTVVAGITLPCGTSDSVYVYDFSGGSPRRLLESRGPGERDEIVSGVYFSQQDVSGGRLILTLWNATQCGSSTWSELSYNLFRFRAGATEATPIFSGGHDLWGGAGHAYNVQLKPDEFLIELPDRSIDPTIHNRIHVLRYSVGSSPVKRIDPVALQPQDFVDEWLTRPWPEMESRSSGANRDKLEKWHNFLNGDFVAGSIDIVQPCTGKSDQWKIAVSMQWVAGKELPQQFKLYFLVHELGKYRFEMGAISFDPPDGCPGQSPPNQGSPSLFVEDPRKSGATEVAPF